MAKQQPTGSAKPQQQQQQQPQQQGDAQTSLATRNPPASQLTRIDSLDNRYQFGQLVSTAESGDVKKLATALKENLGGGAVNVFDFSRIKVPPGGAEAWEVIDPDTGETQYDKAVVGVLVFWTDQKAFWKKTLDAKDAVKSPPDCYSVDTIRGIGDPGVACATCRMNQFGTAKDNTGKGKACKDVRHLLICREDDALPILLPAPPTSIKGIRQYFLDLAGRSIPYWAAVTEFRIKKKSSGGNDYGIIIPRLVAVLDGEAYSQAQRYSEVVRKLLGKELLTKREDVEGNSAAATGGAPTDVSVNVSGHTGRGGPGGAGYAGDDALTGDDDAPGSTDDDVVDVESTPVGAGQSDDNIPT